MKVSGRLAVDTNAVIAYRAGIPEVCSLVERADIILLPVIVLGELFYGAANDIWIAAACMEFGAALLSRDTHFGYISNLQVINW